MLQELTIGQYYPTDSKLHRLDSRVKLFSVIVYILMLVLYRGVEYYILSTLALLICIKLSHIPFRYLKSSLKPIRILLLFIAIVNIFFVKGEGLLLQCSFFSIYTEGVWQAVYRSVQLTELVLISALMTGTTTPTELTDGLEKALHPLTKLHVPLHEIALMMAIAIRFIPILAEEWQRIKKAQMARGVAFDEGNGMQRLKSAAGLFLPLFASAVVRADALALAMEARGYQPGVERTKQYPLQYKKADATAYLCVAGYVLFAYLVL